MTMKKISCLVFAAGITVTPLVASAQEAAPAAQTGPIVLTPPQAAIVFGAREQLLGASLSPDGTKAAFITPGTAQSSVLQIIDLATGTPSVASSVDGKPLTLSSCGWVSNTRLVCQYYGVSDRSGDLRGFTRLAAFNTDGSAVQSLGSLERNAYYLQSSDGYVVDWRDGTSNKLLLGRTYVPQRATNAHATSNVVGLGVDLIDTETAKVVHVETAEPRALIFIGDGLGNIRIRATDESAEGSYWRGDITYWYRLTGNKQWKPFSKYNSGTREGMRPIAVDPTLNVAYALQKADGRMALYRVSLDGSLKTELAYAHPSVDVDNVITVGRRGHVVAASFSTDRAQAVFFDKEYAALVGKIKGALPRLPLIQILDSSADEKKHLIMASSDVDPGRYYFFDAEAKRLTELGPVRPPLARVALGRVKAITYPASDGTMIPGYLTLPPGASGKNLPAIVMPHGGPSSRDEWGFDWLAQYFVNRGYAVLQPNFRGSAGYGDAWFKENGFKSWRTAIGDVNDAGRWMTKEGIADPSKLAIVGWSYGGYAALQANVVDPDLFKAVVAIAPVTDLAQLRSDMTVYDKANRDFIGDGPHLIEGSPARAAAKFKAPVLIFHGDHDVNVDVDHAKLMDKRLREAGKSSQLVIYPAIDHQLRDATVRADMLGKADAFLDKALKR